MAVTSPAFDELRDQVYAAYREHAPASAAWHERASRSLVAGVSGTVRYFRPNPLYCEQGDGAIVTDLDGNEYIDHFLCGATLLLGHRPPEIEAAVKERREHGALVLNPTLATEVAEQLQVMIPGAERVRLVNSGTEAVMSAMRFARAFTGRDTVIKAHGIYHGMSDQILIGLDDTGKVLGSGIPDAVVAHTAGVAFDDLDAIEQRLAEEDVAAVLVDASRHHGGLFVGDHDFYARLRDIAHQAGALVVFDEVISGFRVAAGGAQQYFGVTADLAVFAKALAVGEKLGAVVGRADIMAVADPTRPTGGPFAYQSGTNSDSTSAQAAALAAMHAYSRHGARGGYDEIADRSRRLGAGLCAAFERHDLPCQFTSLGPIVRLWLTDGPLEHAHCSRLDPRPIELFHLAMITEGVLTIPGSNDFFMSFAHRDGHVDAVVAAADRALDRFDFVPTHEMIRR
jgi:glutamate-1-semialdehyde 2,1-aminomutase